MLRRTVLIGFLLLLLFDTIGQVSFKFAATATSPAQMQLEWVIRLLTCPWTYAAIGGYLATFMCWMVILKHTPIGPAFAASHLEIVTVLLVSVSFLGERLSLLQLIGSLCIIGGVIALAGEKEEAATS